MEESLIVLFCLVDDFCQQFIPDWEKQLITNGLKKRRREGQLSLSEIMTIYIHFHQSHYRDFKNYYLHHVSRHLCHLFPKLISYSRFISMVKISIIPLCIFTQTLTGEETGIYFIDSTIIKVCHRTKLLLLGRILRVLNGQNSRIAVLSTPNSSTPT